MLIFETGLTYKDVAMLPWCGCGSELNICYIHTTNEYMLICEKCGHLFFKYFLDLLKFVDDMRRSFKYW